MVTRRQFLQQTAVAGAAAFWAPALRAQSPQRIVVVGAGLAGLSAAFELAQRGHSVTVLEANSRAGGRILTLRRPWDDGLYCEAGGEWVDRNHQYLQHYIAQFGLELKEDEGDSAIWQDGKLLGDGDSARVIAGYRELEERVDEAAARINIYENPERSALIHLDAMSYGDWLRSLGASEAALARHRIRVNDLMTVDLHEISALHMLYEYALPSSGETESRIRGGNALLPETFVKRLGDKVHFGAAVQSIEHNASGVSVAYLQKGSAQRIEADHAIIAIPGVMVPRLRFTPALPRATADAYRKLGHGRIMKVVLQTRTRFWEKREPSYTGVVTHREAGNIYHSSTAQAGRRGLLTNYCAGWGAASWGPLGPAGQITAAKKLTHDVWRHDANEIERARSWHWNIQPWARGSYGFFAPGQMTSVRPVVAQPVGRIHFAGEHTAVWQGYMNGAVESGLRAAGEVDPAVATLHATLRAKERQPAS